MVDQGVQSFATVGDGALYALNGLGQVVRLREDRAAVVLAGGVQSMQVAPDGVVLALTSGHALMSLTPRDHWTMLDPAVLEFQVAPNGDLYLINDRHELRRWKAGHLWETLQTDTRSFTILSAGTVRAIDGQGQAMLYASLGPYFVLDPAPPGAAQPTGDAPSADEVLAAANIRSQPRYDWPIAPQFDVRWRGVPGSTLPVTSAPAPGRTRPTLQDSSVSYPIPDELEVDDAQVVVEFILEQLDPVRLVEGLGPARMHRERFRCTVYYTAPGHVLEQIVIYIDHDHYHLPGMSEEV